MKTQRLVETKLFQELFEDLKAKTHIEGVIELLDRVNFRFISEAALVRYGVKLPQDEKVKHFQWKTRVLHYAASPDKDLYDTRMLIAIKFMGKQQEKVYIWYREKMEFIGAPYQLVATLTRPWLKSEAMNIKAKKVLMTFPESMTIEERKRWRYIKKKVDRGTNIHDIPYKDSSLYEKNLATIKMLNEGKGFYFND